MGKLSAVENRIVATRRIATRVACEHRIVGSDIVEFTRIDSSYLTAQSELSYPSLYSDPKSLMPNNYPIGLARISDYSIQ